MNDEHPYSIRGVRLFVLCLLSDSGVSCLDLCSSCEDVFVVLEVLLKESLDRKRERTLRHAAAAFDAFPDLHHHCLTPTTAPSWPSAGALLIICTILAH